MSAHRSLAFVLGPYVKQGAVVSKPYNTVSMVKTIEEVLGLEPLGLNDALAGQSRHHDRLSAETADRPPTILPV